MTVHLQAGVHGTGLAVLVQMLARAQGKPQNAALISRAAYPGFPAVERALVQMTAIAPADTTTAGWASELIETGLAGDFVQAVRARTVLDRLGAVRRVPFNTSVPVESSPPSGAWVGAGAWIPAGRSQFDLVTMPAFRAGVIVPLSRELIESAKPQAIAAIRESLVRGVTSYQDTQFLDPSVAAVTDVSPASINNGATQVSSTGSTAAAMTTDLANMIAAAEDLINPVWIANGKTIATISATLGMPNVKLSGGDLFGIPIIATKSSPAPVGSPAMPRLITLLEQDAVLLADEGEVQVLISTVSAIQQQSAPSAGPQNTVSLFQTDSVAVRVTRRMNWKRSRTTGAVHMEVSY